MSQLEEIIDKKEKVLQGIVRHFPYFITPNALTMMRLILLPFIIFLILDNNYTWALIVFIFAFFLDLLDGPLARVRNQTTLFGAMLDPLADKLLFITILVLVAYGNLPTFLLAVMIGLEIIIMFIAGILAPIGKRMQYRFRIGANNYGKYKMFLQVIGLIILMLNPSGSVNRDLAILIFSGAIFFSAMSIGDHIKVLYK